MDEVILLNSKINIYKNLDNIPNDVVVPSLIHANNILEIKNGNEDLKDIDGLITSSRNIKIGVKTADCAPVCYSDGEKIGIAHIGWPGLCTDLNDKMLKNFDLSKIKIFIGPFIHRFEIQRDFCFDKLKDNFIDFIEYEGDKLFFNFKEALLSKLNQHNLTVDNRDTFYNTNFPSYRRNKTKERFLTVISFYN